MNNLFNRSEFIRNRLIPFSNGDSSLGIQMQIENLKLATAAVDFINKLGILKDEDPPGEGLFNLTLGD